MKCKSCGSPDCTKESCQLMHELLCRDRGWMYVFAYLRSLPHA